MPAKIAAICECIDCCFAFAIWCDDFATTIDPMDLQFGQSRGFDLISNASRLMSFLGLRKLDDFLGGSQSKPDDLTAAKLGIDASKVLGDINPEFLTKTERNNINKNVAHLTESLSLDADSEVDLRDIIKRSMPAFLRLVAGLRTIDAKGEAKSWLDHTEELIKRGK